MRSTYLGLAFTRSATGYVQPKWLTEPKIMSLSQPEPHIA